MDEEELIAISSVAAGASKDTLSNKAGIAFAVFCVLLVVGLGLAMYFGKI